MQEQLWPFACEQCAQQPTRFVAADCQPCRWRRLSLRGVRESWQFGVHLHDRSIQLHSRWGRFWLVSPDPVLIETVTHTQHHMWCFCYQTKLAAVAPPVRLGEPCSITPAAAAGCPGFGGWDRGGPAAKGPHPEAMTPPPSLLWWAGWQANRLPPRLALLLPAPILRAAYRQLWRDWAER